MTDTEILKLLATLGIDELSYKALPLLPLIHVAWADGEIQEGERVLVEETMERSRLGSEAELLVRNWLRYPPTADYVERGRTALVALAIRGGDLQLEEDVLADVVRLSRDVAQAAGGLWGFGSISREERAALETIAEALEVESGTAWQEDVSRELAEEPPRQRVLIRFDTDTLDLGKMPGVLVPVNDPEQRIPVKGTLVLGAEEACDITVDGGGVDGRHCEIRTLGGRFYVKDLDSSRGTFVDDERVVDRRLLGGEILRFGPTAELRFQLLRRVPKQML